MQNFVKVIMLLHLTSILGSFSITDLDLCAFISQAQTISERFRNFKNWLWPLVKSEIELIGEYLKSDDLDLVVWQ